MNGKFAVRRWFACITAGAVALGGLAGCGGSEESATEPATPAATKAPTATVPAELQGSWTRRVTARQVKHMRSDVNPGNVTIKFVPDGSLEIYYPGATTTEDCVAQFECESFEEKTSGNKVTIGDTALCTGTGEYSFEVSGNKLTTMKITDQCRSDRPALFDGTTWRRNS